MVLIAGTVCLLVLGVGVFAGVHALLNPDAPLSGVGTFLAGVTNTLVGLLAGYLAGRSERAVRRRDDDEVE